MTTEVRNVSPKKLPAGLGWGVLAGHDAQPGEVVKVVTRKGKTWETTLVEEIQHGVWSTTDTEEAPGATRERLEHRLEQRETWADSREAKRDTAWAEADLSEEKTGIPLGQPILVGHHSERRHRKVIERADRKGFEGLEHQRMAERHHTAGGNLERQLRTSIYDDDPDALERLREKLEGLEAQRERVKTINQAIRKGTPLDTLSLTEGERKNLAMAAQYQGIKGYPPYVLQNLGGLITRTRQRIGRLERLRA